MTATTITRTSPLTELHPDAPITITRRQLERACTLRLGALAAQLDWSESERMGAEEIVSVAKQVSDELLGHLAAAAQQLQTEQVPA